MLDEIFKSVKSDVYGRASSPLLGSFIISWSLCNYKFLMLLISDLDVIQKYRIIDKFLFVHWLQITLQCFVIPLLIALAWIFIYPRAAKPVFEFSKKRQKELFNIGVKIEDDRHLSEKKARALRMEMSQLKSSHAKETEDLHQQIDDLKNELNSIQVSSGKGLPPPELPPMPVDYETAKLPEDQVKILKLLGKKDEPIPEKRILDLNINNAVAINYALGELEKKNYIRKDYDPNLRAIACELKHKGREYLVKNP